MKRMVKPLGLAASVLFFFVGVFYLISWISAGAQPVEPPPAPQRAKEPGILRFPEGAPQLSAIKVAPVDEFPVPLAEPLNGRVAYDENATARVSSPILGRVVRLEVLPGDTVKEGDTLLVMDSPDLAQAVSDMAKARADEVRKKQAFDRSKSLLEGGVVPRKDFESAEADYMQARAETRRAELRLQNLHVNPDAAGGDGHFNLRAPMGGVVADRQANPGMEVRPDLQNPLFVITSPARLWVIIDLPERNLSKVAVGHPVSVEVDAYPDQRFRGTIQRIGEIVDPVTRRVQVRCTIANPDRKLKPEMFARVTLLADENKRAVRVPNSALITEGLYAFVFVEKQTGVYEKRSVKLGVQDRDYSYIESGLEPGSRIVTVGPLLLNAELKSSNQSQ
jgi:membrane fusion protein, heavy metal efflux system